MTINAVQTADQIEILQVVPQATITVANGLNGRRGSYFFVGLLNDPNSASDYTEITGNADVHLLQYDVYFSSTSGWQWQYLYNISGVLTWQRIYLQTFLPVPRMETTVTASAATNLTITHNFGTYNVQVIAFQATTPQIDVGIYVERLSINSVNVKLLDVAVPGTNYTFVVVGYPT